MAKTNPPRGGWWDFGALGLDNGEYGGNVRRRVMVGIRMD